MKFPEKANVWGWKNRLGLGSGIQGLFAIRYEIMFSGDKSVLKLYWGDCRTVLILMKSMYAYNPIREFYGKAVEKQKTQRSIFLI